MQTSLYVALSAQMSLQKRLETIANNVANVSTAGFRAEEVKFETLLSHTSSTTRSPSHPPARATFRAAPAKSCGPTICSTSPSRAMHGWASRPRPGPSIPATAA